MYLLNGTDDPLSHAVSITPPRVDQSGYEMHTPPRTFHFGPGEVVEVPDEAGPLLLAHLEKAGLCRYDLKVPLDEQRAACRRRQREWLEGMIRDFQQDNLRRQQQGLPWRQRTPELKWAEERLEALSGEIDEGTRKLMERQLPPAPVTAPIAADPLHAKPDEAARLRNLRAGEEDAFAARVLAERAERAGA